ncbi:mannosyltransferase family protein [Curtobacterium sp. A7_M15]|uniref:mannosyltransferase family protein n=1 Tax=Curtobacterium sp. A7_M15 TaxID=3065241 RepID=UPI0027379D21|nr:mannosyltransferase family protein [Curtobacterium sp. A7_M15]MDP4333922.1 mannosyltransferase family protein [Curtobacterium sp. A7_M15]
MADGLTTAGLPRLSPARARWHARYRVVPWWVRITVVYVLARIVTGAMLAAFASVQAANSFTVQHPGLLSFSSIWDGAWYRVIAASGYPSTLPIDATGHVTENAWAFMPAYPFLVRGLMALTGASFELVAVSVSLLFGWGAALVFRRLMGRFLDPSRATYATVLFCVAPVSAMFQVAYAESMGLFLLLVALLLMVDRRWWSMLPVVLLLGMTRPTGLAFALLIVLFLGAWAFRPSWVRASSPLTVQQFVPPAVVAVVSGAVGLAWPAIAWAVTGVPKAYTDTELAWRSSYIGWKELVPFAPWVQGFGWWFGQPAGAILLAVVVVGFAAFVALPAARRIGLELRLWGVAYLVYLLAVFFPQSSTWRILLPIAPLLGIVALPRSRVYRVAVVVVCIALQWVWMYFCWWIDGYDWTPP